MLHYDLLMYHAHCSTTRHCHFRHVETPEFPPLTTVTMRRMILKVDWLRKLWKGSRPMSFFKSAWVLRRRMFHLPAHPPWSRREREPRAALQKKHETHKNKRRSRGRPKKRTASYSYAEHEYMVSFHVVIPTRTYFALYRDP